LTYAGGALQAALDVPVDSGAKLTLGITEDHNPVHSGDQLTYTVELGNTGTQALPLSSAGVLTATLPAGTTFVSASTGGTSVNGKVQWNAGSVNPGGNQRYSYTVSVGSLADGTVLVPFVELLDGYASLVRASTQTEVRATLPLRLTMIADPDPTAANSGLYYEYKITNTSSSTLTNVTLSEQTFFNATMYPAYSTGGGGCGGGNCGPSAIVNWPAFTLTAGQTQTIWMTSGVSSLAPSGALIHNNAILSYAGGALQAALDVPVDTASNLHLDMTADHEPVKPGENVTYTLALSNTGTQALPLSSQGVLTVPVPVGATFVSAAGGTQSNGKVQWSVGSINPGSVQHYSFTVTAGASLADGSVLQSMAEFTDSLLSLARAWTTTEVRTSTPVSLQVTVAPDPVAPNALLVYTYVVTNTSSGTLTNVVLSEQTRSWATGLPGSSTGGASCGGGNCGPSAIVNWPAFTLASGQQQTVTLTSQIYSTAPDGTLVHSDATLSYTGGALIHSTAVAVHH